MRVLVVLGHPDKGSFNHAIAREAIAALRSSGHDVVFHDLYEESFDPVLRSKEIPKGAPLDEIIRRHCEEVSSAQGIVVIHPNWWGQPPAILKGWVDRVIRPGVAYEFVDGDGGDGVPVGLLRAHTALVLNTSNTPKEREERVFGDPLEALWKNCVFDLCGVAHFHRKTYGVVVTSTPEQRKAWLRDVEATVTALFSQHR